jgi:hypothetical protein
VRQLILGDKLRSLAGKGTCDFSILKFHYFTPLVSMRLDSFEAHKNLIFLNLEECVALLLDVAAHERAIVEHGVTGLWSVLLDVAVHGSSIVGQGRAMSKFNSGIFAVTGVGDGENSEFNILAHTPPPLMLFVCAGH